MKTKFHKQKNGRVRGLSGLGDGPHQEVSPMGHATCTKSLTERCAQFNRRQKSRDWEE